MDNLCNGRDGYQLLLASGFTPDADADCFVIRYDEVPAIAGPECITVRVTGLDGKMPHEDNLGYRAVAASSLPGILPLAFGSLDARDIMAFTVACRNEQVALQGRHSDIQEDQTFVHEDIQVHNPFLELAYGDWAVQGEPDGLVVTLADPQELYGEAYLGWRDSYAEKLAPAAPTPGL